ncbi:MAG: Sec-independent protein translocase protein TatB [Thiobacillus sp.]
MFDIGFSELVVVGVVALIVIGPERLPKVARTAGHLLGRFQRYASSVKSDISREMQLDELRKVGEGFKESVESTISEVQSQANVVDDYLKEELGYSDKALTQQQKDPEAEWDESPDSPVSLPSAPQHPQQSLDLEAEAPKQRHDPEKPTAA